MEECKKTQSQLLQEVGALRKGLVLLHAAVVRREQSTAEPGAPHEMQGSPMSEHTSHQAPVPQQQPDVQMQEPSAEQLYGLQSPGAEASAPMLQQQQQQKRELPIHSSEYFSAAAPPHITSPGT